MSEPERAFINAHLIDPAQELDTNGSLLVRDGKIAAIGTDIESPVSALQTRMSNYRNYDDLPS